MSIPNFIYYIRMFLHVRRHNRHIRQSRKEGVVLSIGWDKTVSDMYSRCHIPDYNHWVYYQQGINNRREKLLELYTQGLIELSRSDVVVDIGANVGDFSHEIAKLVRKVVAIEPDPDVFLCLQKNLFAFDNIELQRVAIGPNCKEQILFTAPKTNDSSLIKSEGICYGEKKVSVVRLDNLLKDYKSIKLLKCDAEGFEPEVISSIEGIANRIQYISVDCSEERNGLSTLKEVKELLKKYKFSVLTDSYKGRMITVAQNKYYLHDKSL